MHTSRRRPGVAAAVVALGVSLIASSGCGDLTHEELSRGVESLGAMAAEGQLVANGVASDSTKTTYARVMAKTLGGEAQHEAEKLADAEPEPELSKERDGAVQISGELADLFSELQTFPGDERRGELVEGQLKEVQDQTDALVERLAGEEQ